jgi:hypothetical protein
MAQFWRENQLVWTKKRAGMDLENQGAKVRVPRHGPTQGFNFFLGFK